MLLRNAQLRFVARTSLFASLALGAIACGAAVDDGGETEVTPEQPEATVNAQAINRGGLVCGACSPTSTAGEVCRLVKQYCDKEGHLHCDYDCPTIVLPGSIGR
ncbi:MAG: hypothetical protein IPG50_15415 [Myxococcales bacterium]|nr:hypothetical protein [Myxococcales bacterium]